MKGQKLIPLAVIAAGLLAYCNSFTGPFIFDDTISVLGNQTIRHLWPIWQTLSPPHAGGITVEGRPLINLSLAVNYAFGGYDVWGYHAFNLAVHILAGLTLLGVVRRTLLQPALRGRFGTVASELALATAVIWTVHPLQTESVAYISQRAESMMGLFYLLTLYCFIRSTDSQRPLVWYGLCVSACALGMASKEVMVSSPVMVLLYDWAFASGSFREAWRRHGPLYLALAAAWIVLGAVLVSGQLPATVSIARRNQIAWWEYLASQPGVILYYLQLSVWPHPLCFDYYGWPTAKVDASFLASALVVTLLVAASIWALKTKPRWGFLGAWFFLILAPTSSIVPLNATIFEHRMYLPLAAMVVLAVLGIQTLAVRRGWSGWRRLSIVAGLAIVLGSLTWRRNQDYRTAFAIWEDTLSKRPNNPRAYANVGVALMRMGRLKEATAHLRRALELLPDYPEANESLADILAWEGQLDEGVHHYKLALQANPDWPEVLNNLGLALARQGKLEDAVTQFSRALELDPTGQIAESNLALALMKLGRFDESLAHASHALELDPQDAQAHYTVGVVLEKKGQLSEAAWQYADVLRIQPYHAEARSRLAAILEKEGQTQKATRQ